MGKGRLVLLSLWMNAYLTLMPDPIHVSQRQLWTLPASAPFAHNAKAKEFGATLFVIQSMEIKFKDGSAEIAG